MREGRTGWDGAPVALAATAAPVLWLLAATSAAAAVAAEILRQPDRYFISAVISFDLMVVAAVLAVAAVILDRPRTRPSAAGAVGALLAVAAVLGRAGNGQAIAAVRLVVVLELAAAVGLGLAAAPGVRAGWPAIAGRALRSLGSAAAGLALVLVVLDLGAAPIVSAGRRPELVGLLVVAGIGLVGGARERRWPVALAWAVGVAARYRVGADGPAAAWLVPLGVACALAWIPSRTLRAGLDTARAGGRRALRGLGAGLHWLGGGPRWARRVLGSPPRSSAAPAPTRTLGDLGPAGRWTAGALGALTVVAAAATVVHARRIGWFPIGDDAIIATRAGDVGTRHTPLVGMPTTLGPGGPQGLEVHHLGPLQFWITSPFVRLLGPSLGIMVAAAAVWLAAVGASAWAAFRARGPVAALLAYGAALVVALTAASGVPFEPLNAHVPILPLFAAYVLAWAAACGVRWALVWAVGLGSLCIQSYVPMAPSAAVALLFATAVVAVPRLRPPGTGSPRRVLLAAGAVAVAAWSGPVVDAAANDGGNLRELLQTEHARVATVGLGGGLRALLGLVSVPPTWLAPGPFRVDHASTYLHRGAVAGAVVLLALVAGTGWRWRAWDQGLRRLVVLGAAGLGAGAATLARLPAEFVFGYQVWWVGAVAAFAWFALAVVLVREARAAWTGSPAVVAGARAVLVAVVAVLLVAVGWPRDLEHYSRVAATSQLAAQDVARQVGAGPGGDAPVAVLADGRSWEQVVANAVAMSLADRGRDIRVTPLLGGHWGTFRLAPQDPSDPVLIVSDGFSPEGPGVGRRIARIVPPGWSQADADATAARVAAWARSHGPIQARFGFGGIKRSVVNGWDPDLSCEELDALKQAQVPLDSLPDGAIAELYLEGVIASPTLPAELFDEVQANLLATPTEVWLTDAAHARGATDGPVAGPCN